MADIRLLVGTRKGIFTLSSDTDRRRWEINGPHHGGWEAYHVQGAVDDPDRLYGALWSGWHGTLLQRSSDGGETWETASNEFTYAEPGITHTGWEGEQTPWAFKRVWHLAPVPPGWAGPRPTNGADGVLAGVEDAALFWSPDGGGAWKELLGLRTQRTNTGWQPGAGGLCLHTILFDPSNGHRLYVAISAAGAFRSDDAGATWQPINRGLRTTYTPDPEPETGYCVHKIAMHPSRPHVLFMQKHFGVYRSDNAGESWTDISDGLRSNFGFPIAVHAHEPDTVYVVPITDDSQHYPPDGMLRVWRTRDGGGKWESLARGLPDRNCYVNVLRDSMAVDRLDPGGIYFGTTGGQVYASRDGGDTWEAAATHLPPVLSVEAQTLR